MQLSVIDQENAIKKIAQWSELSPSSHYFFQPYKEKNSTMECDDSQESLLWVHQQPWQQLMVKYKDATYKITQYDLPLFFISVRTNTRYCVVDVVQSESLTTSKKLFKFCKHGTPNCIQSFSWPTILRQKLELWRHLSQVLLFTSAIFIESRPGSWQETRLK